MTRQYTVTLRVPPGTAIPSDPYACAVDEDSPGFWRVLDPFTFSCLVTSSYAHKAAKAARTTVPQGFVVDVR